MRAIPVLMIVLGVTFLPVALILFGLGYGQNWTTIAIALISYSIVIALLGVVVYALGEWSR